MSTAPSPSFYQTGGTMTTDAPSYVERQADRELFDALTLGEFCYVLHARPMGKSSLMAEALHARHPGGFWVTSPRQRRIRLSAAVASEVRSGR